jgi:hypothetical protein
MDISGIARLSTALTQQQTSEAAQLMVLKKALNMQESAAQTLIASVTPSSSLPSHLGQHVNVVA